MNAKTEFIKDRSNDFENVLCAEISCNGIESILKVDHSKEDYDIFVKSLDYNYDNDYGWQELHGIIWYKDGTYADRGVYDGSEWWRYHLTPEIPETLK